MSTLGPRLFELLNQRQHVGNQTPVEYGAPGMSPAEVRSVEAKLGFTMPDDFAYLLQNVRDPGGTLFPWASFTMEKYEETVGWVLHGIEFDVEHGLWLERWGRRPHKLATAVALVRNDFATWPRLLPIYGHRFLAAEPCRTGNPVFSIVQTDIIYYGSDLGNYLMNEFISDPPVEHLNYKRIRRVDVWSDFAERIEPPLGPPRRS
jgi:hypothetical protein